MSLHLAKKTFYSFDGAEELTCNYADPDRYRDLLQLPRGNHYIVLGGGYSYVPAGLSASACVIRSRHFNRILAFDQEQKRVTVEAGISLGRLYEFLYPRKLALAILPGYPEITVGGCIAANIHGKNQFKDGVFGDIVTSVKLFHPLHGILNLSWEENGELLAMTCGGYGLTGIILEATLQLSEYKGRCVRRMKIPIQSNEDLFLKIQEAAKTADMIYSWQNFTSSKRFGSGFLYLGSYTDEHAEIDNRTSYNILDSESRFKRSWPFFNYPSTLAFNALYQLKESLGTKTEHLSHFEFSFPVTNKMIYFQLFGKQGFHEYQVIVPLNRFLSFTSQLERLCKTNKLPVTLASCKLFKGKQRFLHFNSDGACLAIDVPASKSSRKTLGEIDKLVLSHEGLPNIGKDSRLTAGVAAQTFKEFELFRGKLRQFDPELTFQSQLRQRLEL